jgi:hypothetical protein
MDLEPDGDQRATKPDTAGQIYARLISQQLKDEQDRKTSLEQRGLAVISTSGILVSLLFGLGAVTTTRPAALGLPTLARFLLIAAVVAFVVGASFGLATNAPRTYAAIAMKDLKRMVTEDLWNKAEDPASRRVAENRVELVDVSRSLNAKKASLLEWALRFELAGVFLVAGSVTDLLLQR